MIRWFARNDVAANLLFVTILLLGLHSAFERVPLEVNPTFDLPQVWIDVTYRGGSPEDVERHVCIPIERSLMGLSGVDRIVTQARRDRARIRIEAKKGTDLDALLDDVESRVNAISTFPNETERPRFSVPNTEWWFEVIKVAITADLPPLELRRIGQQIQEEITELPEISLTELQGEGEVQMTIEADEKHLRDYGLSLQDLSSAITRSSLSLSAGSIETTSSNILLRTEGQALTRQDFADLPLINAQGAQLTLGDVATVREEFSGERSLLRFNGKPAMLLEIMRTGDENAIHIADAIKSYVERSHTRFPQGVALHTWEDESLRIKYSLGTLLSSMATGALLVLLILGLFLRPLLAFWVVLGIPMSFAGGLLLMPTMGITANLMSVFGFIIVLGIVVDDAIVTGENIYQRLRQGQDPLEAAVQGTQEVATPVTFGMITTVVAFVPMLFFEGFWGNFTRQIPPVVAAILLFSLIESKLILPGHLKHLRLPAPHQKQNPLSRLQLRLADFLEHAIQRLYRPLLSRAIQHRYLTLSLFIASALLAAGYWKTGKMGYVALPQIEGHHLDCRFELPEGTTFEDTEQIVEKITQSARQLQTEFQDPTLGRSLVVHILSYSGERQNERRGRVRIELLPEMERSQPGPPNDQLVARWRQLIGPLPGVEHLRVYSQRGGGRHGAEETEPLQIQIRGPDGPHKIQLVEQLKALLRQHQELPNVWSDDPRQADEFTLRLKPRANELGLSQRELARQIRTAFYGDEVQRLQRGRDELRVVVRLPETQRQSTHTLDTLNVQAPNGTVLPLSDVATLTLGKAPGNIQRIDGAQVTHLTASPRDSQVDLVDLAQSLTPQLDDLFDAQPGFTWAWEGFLAEFEEQKKRERLSWGAILFALYALLAIPFRSLLQPLVVLLAVPFGLIGALLGHLIMDQTPSGLSTFGMMALAGVVVNDSLVLVDYLNRHRQDRTTLNQAILDAGERRFRPILLTSLTTFAGLLPLILDQSTQAAFLVPMAISLGWGILFATFITLLLVPVSYRILEDLRHLVLSAQNPPEK